MILSAQSILSLCRPPGYLPESILPMIDPFTAERTVFAGQSYGLGPAGYDIRVRQAVRLGMDEFVLASSMERFAMPDDVLGIVHDKSTLARSGLSVFNTVIEPGWTGFLTLELKNQGMNLIDLPAGSPVAQVVFHRLDHRTILPYRGKYQDQADRPVAPIQEKSP